MLFRSVVPYQLEALEGQNGQISNVVLKTLDGQVKRLEADALLAFFGLAMNLGPIATGASISNATISRSTRRPAPARRRASSPSATSPPIPASSSSSSPASPRPRRRRTPSIRSSIRARRCTSSIRRPRACPAAEPAACPAIHHEKERAVRGAGNSHPICLEPAATKSARGRESAPIEKKTKPSNGFRVASHCRMIDTLDTPA